MPRIWSLAATLIVSPLAYRPTDESILQEEAHVAFDQLWWSRCPSTKSSGIVTDFLKFVPPTCEKSLENIWCDLHKFAKNPKNKDFLKSMGPEQWAQSIAESLFSGGPDVSDGRLFLPPGQKGQEYGRLLVLGDKREATKEIGGIELSELEVNKYWSRRIPLGHKFKLQPELRNCPIFVATSIWKTAAKWALAAYNNIGADLLVNYGKLQTAAGSTMSSLPGLIWEVDGRCTQDERGCVETVAVEPGEPVECTLWLIQGHEGHVDEFKEDSGLGISASAELLLKGANKSKSLSKTDHMKAGDKLTIRVQYKAYTENMTAFKKGIRYLQSRYNYGRRGSWRGCLRPSKSWSFLSSTLQAFAVEPTSAGVNLSPPRREKCQETTKAFKSFVETVVEKPQVEQAKAAWLNVVSFRCNERSFNSEKPWMMNETRNDQNHHDAYLDMLETGRGPFSQDTPQCRKQVMNLTDLLKKQNFSSDVIYSLLTGGLDASRGKLYNISKTLKRPLSFWVGFEKQDAVDLAKSSNMTDMTYLLHQDLPLGEALHDASVDALSHCEPKRQGPLRASSSLSMLRYHKVAQHALYIHVNATLKTMRSGILNIFWEFERPQISSQPPIAGIQVFSYPGGEKCNELMPALRKSWEERGEDSTNWRLVRFLACHDLGPYEEKGQQERKPFPEGKIFRKPFEPCTTMANIANKDWAQGVFLAEDRDEDTHCLNLTRQLPNFKIVMASQPLKSGKKNKKWQVVERALTNNPFVEGLVLLGVGLTDETLKNLTAAMLEGSKRFIFGQNQGALKQHAEKNSRKLRRRSVYSKPNRRKWSLYLHGNCVTNVHDALEPLLNDHVTLTELTLNEEFLDPSVVESTMGDLGNMRKNGLSKFTSHCPQDMRQTHSKWCPHWKKGHNLQESLEGIKKMKGPMITVRKGILKTKRSMRFTYDINNQSNFELLQDREIRAIWSGGKIDPEECKSKKEKTNWWSSWRKPGNWSFWRKKNK